MGCGRAAITEYFSIQTEISWTGGRVGSGGWPGACEGGSSREISDISTKSSSRIILATFEGRTAAGLLGPRPDRAGGGAAWS